MAVWKLVVEKLRQNLGIDYHISAGNQCLATSMMLKAGANGGQWENGSYSGSSRYWFWFTAIIAANAFSGESLSDGEAIATSNAAKVLLPINRYGLEIAEWLMLLYPSR